MEDGKGDFEAGTHKKLRQFPQLLDDDDGDSLKLYDFFWVISRRLNCICRRFGTLSSIFIGG
jgi:hypothetical protein